MASVLPQILWHAGTTSSFPDAACGPPISSTVRSMWRTSNLHRCPSGPGRNLGQNVATGLYGGGGARGTNPDPEIGTCLFCEPDKLGMDPKYSYAPYNWGPYRTVMIALWNNPEWWVKDKDTGLWRWAAWDDPQFGKKGPNGDPQRVTITMFHAFRIYRDASTKNSEAWGSGPATRFLPAAAATRLVRGSIR